MQLQEEFVRNCAREKGRGTGYRTALERADDDDENCVERSGAAEKPLFSDADVDDQNDKYDDSSVTCLKDAELFRFCGGQA
jgi:hypothetical protein